MIYRLIEYVPMPEMGIHHGDAIGISIPSKNGIKAWNELESVISLLEKRV